MKRPKTRTRTEKEDMRQSYPARQVNHQSELELTVIDEGSEVSW